MGSKAWLCRIAVFSAMVLNAVPARAQSEAVLRGQVVATDGSPLSQSTVTLRPIGTGSSDQAIIDVMGRFTFQTLRPGEYVLSATSDGFTPQELRVVLGPREVRAMTLVLEVERVEVRVDVTAEPVSLPSTHSPSSTTLTSDWLEALPALQRTTLPDAIVTAAPGMIRGHDDFVHIRGEEVALSPLINGVAFWENAHVLFSAGVSPDVIDTANVMTGGFRAEYGNRFGGVVDIVTKSGLRMDRDGSLTASAGEAGRRSVAGEMGGHRGDLGYYILGSVFESDRFLSPPAPVAIHDHGRGGHAFFQLDGNMGSGGALRAIVMGDGANFDIPKAPQDVALRPLANASQRTRQQTAILGWTQARSDLLINASFYQRWSRSELFPTSGPLTATAQLERQLGTVGGKVDVSRFAGRHTIKAGLDGVRLSPREDLSYDYAGYHNLAHFVGLPHIHITDNSLAFTGRESGGQVSFYAQDDIQVSDRLTADVGLRVDRHDLLFSTTHASPRINLALRLGGSTALHASYNQYFVPPPIDGVRSSAAGLTGRIREIGVSLPPVQPTTEHQFELGASAPAGPLHVGVTAYYRASDNPVHTTVWPDSRIYSYASFDRARAYGLEVKADAPRLARYAMTGYVNYALGRVYFYNAVTGGFITEPEHLTGSDRFLAPMDQTHTFTAGLTYRHARTGVFAGTAWEYGSGTPREHEHGEDESGDADHEHALSTDLSARVPGHLTANVSLGIDLLRRANRRPRLSLRIDVENVGNHLYVVAQESEFTPGQYSMPRLISARLKWRF